MSRVTRSRALGLLTGCVLALGLLGASATAKSAAKPKLVTINDFYFGPDAVTVPKGGAVKWVWAATNTFPHDVHLKQGPRGLKQKGAYSTKTSAVSNARFQKSFPTPGTYKYICTIHPTEMKLTVTVKK